MGERTEGLTDTWISLYPPPPKYLRYESKHIVNFYVVFVDVSQQ